MRIIRGFNNFGHAMVFGLLITLLALTPLGVSKISLAGETKLENSGPSYVPGQVIVKYKARISRIRQTSIQRASGVDKVLDQTGPKGRQDICLCQLENGQTVRQTVNALKADPAVELAIPNYLFKSAYTPNDPGLFQQWALNNTGQNTDIGKGTPDADIDAPEGWSLEQGYSSPVTVAVLDTGIDLDHPDLINKLWTNSGEIPDNQIDDDHNGFVDDVHGYNFAGIANYHELNPYASEIDLPDTYYEVAQSITGTGGGLNSIGFDVAREGTPTAPLRLSVRDDLNGPDLAGAVINPLETTTTMVPEIRPLGTTIKLNKGKTYYLIAKVSDFGVMPEDHYILGTSYYPAGQDEYREGMVFWPIGANWLSFRNYDLNFFTNDFGVPHDDSGHGTHVSGIIGAETNNGAGVAGVAPGVKIMSLKTGDTNGTHSLWAVAEGLFYAADNGADVANMSFSGALPKEDGADDFEQIAINYATAAGVTLVAAADEDQGFNYPAAYNNVISVVPTNFNDQLLSGFSSGTGKVDFSAPGVGIYSTMPTYPVGMNSEGFKMNYDFCSGSSMAAPVVSGVAALIRAQLPAAAPFGVAKVLEKGADDLGDPGFDRYYGYGRVNLYASLRSFILDTLLTSDPSEPDGENGWYKSFPAIGLTPSLGNSTAHYSWDDSPAATTYTIPFFPPAEGRHKVSYYSTMPGVSETAKTKTYQIDSTEPSNPTDIHSPSHTPGALSKNNVIAINFSNASDALSGVKGYGCLWSKDSYEVPAKAVNLMATGGTENISAQVADGKYWFNLRTEDKAGNWAGAVHYGPFTIDTKRPAGSISINSGNRYTKYTAVKLNLSASDSGTGIAKMRLKNAGGGWSDWMAYSGTKNWTLSGYEGNKQVYCLFRDKAGNISPVYSDTIIYDRTGPKASASAPPAATKTSTNRKFRVKWAAKNSSVSGIANYDIQYKFTGGYWKNWFIKTKANSKLFDKGKIGQTVFFKVRARDKAGNRGSWSKVAKTIIPYDGDNQLMDASNGFNLTYANLLSNFYYGSVRYSARSGESISYTFTGRQVALIGTKAANRSKAYIFIDNHYVRTVDAYSPTMKYRQVLFNKKWGSRGVHSLAIVNDGTPGRRIFDIDALAVDR